MTIDRKAELFRSFVQANTCQSILTVFHDLCDVTGVNPSQTQTSRSESFYDELKSKLTGWKPRQLWAKLDKRVYHKDYKGNQACSQSSVLIIGAGPCGLRTAIECRLLGARTVVVEKRDSFSRNNVLHLWPFVITDLKSLGAKHFYPKFCAGAIDHISIRMLQCILLKLALLVGVEVHVGVGYEGLVEPVDMEVPSDLGIPGGHTNGILHESAVNGSITSALEKDEEEDTVMVGDENGNARVKGEHGEEHGEEHGGVDGGQNGVSGPTGGRTGWRAQVSPPDHPVSHFEFDVLIGADGKRNTLQGFDRKEFRGKLAIAITANFINRFTQEEARVEEISGVAYIFNQSFFDKLLAQKGVMLENIVYYKDDTHYFVMTAKKESLLKRGVLKEDRANTVRLLSKDNIDTEALCRYAMDAAQFSTNYKLPDLEYAISSYRTEDIAMFDFTSIFSANNSSRVVERAGHKLLVGIVGDSLLEPFWPTGSGCARGFLGCFDAAWMIRSWAGGSMTPLQVLAERESVYQLLSQSNPENLTKNLAGYSINPLTRYPNCNTKSVKPNQVRHLYDAPEGADLGPESVIDIPLKKTKTYDFLVDSQRLLKWLQVQTVNSPIKVHVEDLQETWRDGKALCALLHRFNPDLVDPQIVAKNNAEANICLAYDVAKREYGITPALSTTELHRGKKAPDLLAMVSYLSQFQDLLRGRGADTQEEISEPTTPKKSKGLGKKERETAVSKGSSLARLSSKMRGKKSRKASVEGILGGGVHRKDYKDSIKKLLFGKGSSSARKDMDMITDDQPSRFKQLDGESSGHTTNLVSQIANQYEQQAPGSSGVGSSGKGASSDSGQCYFCSRRVYLVEQCSAEGLFFHRNCFKCDYCLSGLSAERYKFKFVDGEGKFYCQHHYGMQRHHSIRRKREAGGSIKSRPKLSLPFPQTSNDSIDRSGISDTGPSDAKISTTNIPPSSLSVGLPTSLAFDLKTPERIEFENEAEASSSSQGDDGGVRRMRSMSEDDQTEHNFGTVGSPEANKKFVWSREHRASVSAAPDDEEALAMSTPEGEKESALTSFRDKLRASLSGGGPTTGYGQAPTGWRPAEPPTGKASNSGSASHQMSRSEFFSVAPRPLRLSPGSLLVKPSTLTLADDSTGSSVSEEEGETADAVAERRRRLSAAVAMLSHDSNEAEEEEEEEAEGDDEVYYSSSSEDEASGSVSKSGDTSVSTTTTPSVPTVFLSTPSTSISAADADKDIELTLSQATTNIAAMSDKFITKRSEKRRTARQDSDGSGLDYDGQTPTGRGNTRKVSTGVQGTTAGTGEMSMNKPIASPRQRILVPISLRQGGGDEERASAVPVWGTGDSYDDAERKTGLDVAIEEAAIRRRLEGRQHDESGRFHGTEQSRSILLEVRSREGSVSPEFTISTPSGTPMSSLSSLDSAGSKRALDKDRGLSERPYNRPGMLSVNETLGDTPEEIHRGREGKRIVLHNRGSPERFPGNATIVTNRGETTPLGSASKKKISLDPSLQVDYENSSSSDLEEEHDLSSFSTSNKAEKRILSRVKGVSLEGEFENMCMRGPEAGIASEEDLSDDDSDDDDEEELMGESGRLNTESSKRTRTKVMEEAQKQARRLEMRRLHLAQDIQRQLQEVEVQTKEQEEKGVWIEKAIRGEAKHELDDKELMGRWFAVIHAKNVLVRYESELQVRARELELEDRHSRLENMLRDLLLRGGELKRHGGEDRHSAPVGATASSNEAARGSGSKKGQGKKDKKGHGTASTTSWYDAGESIEEEAEHKVGGSNDDQEAGVIFEELISVVQARDALVQKLEEDRLRERQEDEDLSSVMRKKGFYLSPTTHNTTSRRPSAMHHSEQATAAIGPSATPRHAR